MGDVYMVNGKILSGLPNHAKDIEFDNTGTDFISTNAEDAIKEVNSKLTDTYVPNGVYDIYDLFCKYAVNGVVAFTFYFPIGGRTMTLIRAGYYDSTGTFHDITSTSTLGSFNPFYHALSTTTLAASEGYGYVEFSIN